MSVKNSFFVLNGEFFFIKNFSWDLRRYENVDYFAARLTNEVAVRVGITVVMHLIVSGVDWSDIAVKSEECKIAVDRTKTEMWVLGVKTVINHICCRMCSDTLDRLENYLSLVGVSHFFFQIPFLRSCK